MNWLKNQLTASKDYFNLNNTTQKRPPAIVVIVGLGLLVAVLFLI